MLDNFLEYDIQKKLHLFDILQTHSPVSIKQIRQLSNLSFSSSRILLKELSTDLQNLAEIREKDSNFYFLPYNNVSDLDLLHAIYANSNMLKCLKFIITNHSDLPFSTFMEKSFLSKSSAYRIRKNCLNYLHEIGLDMVHNRIKGEEYRIRFLIALLYHKYGIDCCRIDSGSLNLVRNFILSTNHAIDKNFLKLTEKEYEYFECLVILSWKRQQYHVSLPDSKNFPKFKTVFIYQNLKAIFKKEVVDILHIPFTENDYDYLYLVYCCTDNCIMADKWTPKDIHLLYKNLLSQEAFSDLLYRFQETFGSDIIHTPACRAALVYFYKTCLLNLQSIIPGKCFFFHSRSNALTFTMGKCISNILADWKKEQHIKYEIDPHHILYLSFQIKTILQQYIKPVNIIIVSDLDTEIKTLQLFLKRLFAPQRAVITPFLLNAQNMNILRSQKNSIIIVHKKFQHFMETLNVKKENTIIPITIQITSEDILAIQKAIAYYEKKFIADFPFLHET